MPTRSRSRSYSRGRAAKRYRSRSASRGSGMYAMATGSRSRSLSRSRRRSTVRVQGAHTFSRRCAALTEEMNGLYLARSYEVSLSDAVQHTDFSALFDQYRLTKVVFTIQMLNVPASLQPPNTAITLANGQTTNWHPKVWYVVDHDGGATETISTIKERQGVKCRILRPDEMVKISFTPMCRTLTYSTSSSTGYSPKNIKIDMTDTNVEHYGLQVVFDSNGLDPNDTYPFKFVVERKLHFTCYGVR